MKDFKTCVKWLCLLLGRVKWGVLLSIFLGLLRIGSSLCFVWSSKELVDIVTGVRQADAALFVGILVGSALVQICSKLAVTYWGTLFVARTRNGLRQEVFSHFIKSKWDCSKTFHSADAVNRMQVDVSEVVDLLCNRVPSAFVTLCQLVCASAYLYMMAPGLVWLLLVIMVVAIFASKMFYRKFRTLSSEIRTNDSKVQSHMQENIQHRSLVLTLIGTERVLSQLGLLQEKGLDFIVKRQNYSTISSGVMEAGYWFGYVAAFLWGAFGIKDGAVTFGMMTAFLQLVGAVQQPVASLAGQVPAFINSMASTERLIDLEELVPEVDGEDVITSEAPEIAVQDITFAYSEQESPIFKDFSYTFQSGRMTAVAGLTGAGKSTLNRLVLALLEPQKGRILIDGVPVSTSTRCNFMYVPQGNSLMSGTVRENLLLANADAGEAQMRQALHCAAADFVFELPDGLDTVIGETGLGLSEGQAQRIAIARGLLHKGGVLVMDESTSAVDAQTELQILENLKSPFIGRKTIIFISHREAVLEAADDVLKIRTVVGGPRVFEN